jgi:hypothetical protein
VDRQLVTPGASPLATEDREILMSKNQDVIACFKRAFATNEGNQPVLDATIASYNMPVPQVLLILNMTRDCLERKNWHYTVPGSVDTTQKIQLLIASIMKSTTPIPAMAELLRHRPAAKKKKARKPRVTKKKAAKRSKRKKKAAKPSKRKKKR